MGAKEILAYRDRVVMTARQFVALWLEEFPADAPHDVTEILADLLAADRGCIHIPNADPRFDYLRDDTAEARRKLLRETIAALRQLAADRCGLEAIPLTSLSREGLRSAFGKITIPEPEFLKPPGREGPSSNGPTTTETSSAKADSNCDRQPVCEHSDDYRTVIWHGEKFVFTDLQAKAVEALWKEWEKDGLGLSQRRLGEIVESSANRFQLSLLFRKHPAWHRMIHPDDKKGIFKLGPPPT